MNYIFKLIQKLTSNKQLNFQLTFLIKQLTLVNDFFFKLNNFVLLEISFCVMQKNI